MNNQPAVIRVNGKSIDTVSVLDRGLQFGDGVFETIRVHHGQPVWWDAHIERLLEGCRRLRFRELPDRDEFYREAMALSSKVEDGVLKIILTRGNSNSGYRIPEEQEPNRIFILTNGHRHHRHADNGIHLGLCEHRISSAPGTAGIKHLNRLDQVLARIECTENGWDEGVMLDLDGYVIEGTMSNLFAWYDNKLLTPSLESAGVRGICRDVVIEHARLAGFDSEICRLTVDDLMNSEGLFVCNSLIGIWPVRMFLDRTYGETGDRTRHLQNVIQEAMC